MADTTDKLRELTPVHIDFYSGERPTDEKLEGMMQQVEDAFNDVENIMGDLFGDSGVNTLWTTNLGRDLGDRSKLNPVVMPDQVINNYVQQLTLGKVAHELDLIPVGSGSAIIATSTDSSLIPSQYKATTSSMTEVGDWTIGAGKIEGGLVKNSRKLVLFAPSAGGTITLAQVTSGNGSAYSGARLNVIPSVAQAVAGGPFIDVVLSDSINNIYTITLPAHELEYNRTNDSADASISNTLSSLGAGSQAELPHYFFKTDGLDLLADNTSGGPKSIPLNSILIWDWDQKKALEGIEELTCSPNPAARKYQFTVKFRLDVVLNTSSRYMISTAGTSVYEMLGALQREVIFHKHSGDDLVRHIDHADLMNTRTGSSTPSNRSSWYGSSSIDNNHHSMYLHRNGFTNGDTGAGANIMRGTLVVGSTTTGLSTEHENYNLTSDSFALAFGKLVAGGTIKFKKLKTYTLPQGAGTISQNISDNALVITGSTNDAGPGIQTIVEGHLLVEANTVLGTSAASDTLVNGDLYVQQSATLTPKNSAEVAAISPEVGKMVYSSESNAPLFWNGASWVNAASGGYAAVVGDGVSSFGRFNGANAANIQAAINYVQSIGGGKLLIQRGTYNLAATTITVPSKTHIEGEGSATIINATSTAFQLVGASVGSSIRRLTINGAAIGIEVFGNNHSLHNISAATCVLAWVQRAGAANNTFNQIKLTGYSNESTDLTNIKMTQTAVGYINGPYALDPVNKQLALADFKKTSGAGTISYFAGDSAIGTGCFAITGTGTWVIDGYMPINPNIGLGGNVSHKSSVAGGSLTVGAQCFDSALTPLGSNGGFMANAAASTTAWQLKYSFARTESNSGVGNLKVGTRFVKIYIDVTANPGTIYVDSLNVMPMNFASLALYY